jgi:hypothetical protein
MEYSSRRKLNIYKESGTIIYCAAVSGVVKFVVALKNLKPELIYLKGHHGNKEVKILNNS